MNSDPLVISDSSTPEVDHLLPTTDNHARKLPPLLLVTGMLGALLITAGVAYWMGYNQGVRQPSEAGVAKPAEISQKMVSESPIPELAQEGSLYAQMPPRNIRRLTMGDVYFEVPENMHYLQCQGSEFAWYLDTQLQADTTAECNFEPGGEVALQLTNTFEAEAQKPFILRTYPYQIGGLPGTWNTIKVTRGNEDMGLSYDQVVVELPPTYPQRYLIISRMPSDAPISQGIFESILQSIKLSKPE